MPQQVFDNLKIVENWSKIHFSNCSTKLLIFGKVPTLMLNDVTVENVIKSYIGTISVPCFRRLNIYNWE